MPTAVDLDLVDEPDRNVYDVADIIASFGTRATAERLGVSIRTVERWAKNGVNWHTADRIAIKIAGDHPAHIWGRTWWS